MPYATNNGTLSWWFSTLTIKDEVEQYPWLHEPYSRVSELRGSTLNNQRIRIENPTFTGDLCFICRYIDFEWLASGYPNLDSVVVEGHKYLGFDIRIQYLSISGCKRGAKAGCPSCSITLQLLYKALDVHDIPNFLFRNDAGWPRPHLRSPWTASRSRRVRLHVGVRLPEGGAGYFTPCLSMRIGHHVELGDFDYYPALYVISDHVRDPRIRHSDGVMCPVPGGTDTRADLPAVRSLIDQCVSGTGDHAEFSPQDAIKAGEPGSQPTYFVDLQERCLRAGRTDELEYVALSYVWGSVASVELTTENLRDLQNSGSLPPDSGRLPLVVRDAMQACHRLSYRYLWVDRLCVIQDSNVKKDLIANMHTIFASAVVTIVAAAGNDANDALPGVRLGSRTLNHLTAASSSAISFAAAISWGDHAPVWNTRAWTMQEEYCSQRLLYFGSDQLHLSCPHLSRNEEDILNAHSGLPTRMYVQDGLYKYCLAVESYSRRRLTFEEDVYDAFAGILAVLAYGFSNATFIAAMPASFLDYALLFEFHENAHRRTRNDLYGISAWPSWSWLGWKGAYVNHDRVRHDQWPCFRWIPDSETLPYVTDIHLVRASEAVLTEDLLLAEDGRSGEFEKKRHGSQASVFRNIMLEKLHLRTDVAVFRVGQQDPTQRRRFQVLNKDSKGCGVIHLPANPPKTACRFVKISIARTGEMPFKFRGPQALSTFDRDIYEPVKIKTKSSTGAVELIYKVLAIDPNNERLGCGMIHMIAFDAVRERDVDVILV